MKRPAPFVYGIFCARRFFDYLRVAVGFMGKLRVWLTRNRLTRARERFDGRHDDRWRSHGPCVRPNTGVMGGRLVQKRAGRDRAGNRWSGVLCSGLRLLCCLMFWQWKPIGSALSEDRRRNAEDLIFGLYAVGLAGGSPEHFLIQSV